MIEVPRCLTLLWACLFANDDVQPWEIPLASVIFIVYTILFFKMVDVALPQPSQRPSKPSSKPSASNKPSPMDVELPFPGLLIDGEFQVVYECLSVLRFPLLELGLRLMAEKLSHHSAGNKAHLEALCKRFKLPHSGANKAVLVKRLTDFSQKRDKWERSVHVLFPLVHLLR